VRTLQNSAELRGPPALPDPESEADYLLILPFIVFCYSQSCGLSSGLSVGKCIIEGIDTIAMQLDDTTFTEVDRIYPF
jgi:hypothetical protein